MRLVSWNVNGIRAVAKKGFLESFDSFNADIICLQETKAMPEQVPAEVMEIEGYKSYFHAAERKGYSGTALYTRTEPTTVTYGLGEDRFDHEGRTICARYEDFVLYNIYFPNGGQGPDRLAFKLDFYDCFLAKIRAHIAAGDNVIVCGDVNTAHQPIDLSNPIANSKVSGFLPEERVWIDQFIEDGLVDTFRLKYPDTEEKYTWWSYKTFARDRNVGWRIDYFFANQAFVHRISDAGMLSDIMGSDHCPIYLDIE